MPKRVPPLSAKALAHAKPTDRHIELVDGLLPGLRVRILPNGTKSWSLNIRDSKGIRRRFDVGANLGLAEARKRGEELRRQIRNGTDPTAERRAGRQRAQAAREGVGTLAALLEAYYSKGPGSRQRRAVQSKKQLQTVFANLLNRPLLDIERTELQLLVDAWPSTATASLAVRLLRPCLKWGEKRGMVRPGTADLEQPGTVTKRERVLTRDELKAVWANLFGTHGDVIRWLLWTGCRLNEAAMMTWGELAGDMWTIPASRTKNARQRAIPLPRQAVEFLQARGPGEPEELVFPSRRGGGLSNWDRETKKVQAASGTSGWHRHDLRRTVATLLGDIGFAPHVLSVVLGHANIADGATAVYARSRYQQEHRQALQALADELDRIGRGMEVVV
jgi:integrase